ncbi:MAG: hypothetical protein JNG85_11040, partial [Spirochaetaceae bacterium]|nr:hypothetical protein [Spirochaetaceae bacterium]
MRPPKTFRHGGLSLDLERDWRPASPVQNSFLPNAAAILLKQHAGPAARCLVRKGEYVREGALLGKAEGAGSAAIHASVPGVVRDIRRVRLPEGGECEAAVIVLEGSFDRLGKRMEKYLWKGVSRGDLLQTLRDRGVVETEPPGRPLYELLREREKTELLVLNAIESEPYLRTEAAVLADRGPEVLEGFAILRKILAPERWILALDASETEALARAAESAKGLEEAPESILLEPRYPQDLPSLLLEVIQRDRHAAKGKPSAVIVRPSTALAVYEAVALARPFLERYVTV